MDTLTPIRLTEISADDLKEVRDWIAEQGFSDEIRVGHILKFLHSKGIDVSTIRVDGKYDIDDLWDAIINYFETR